MRDTRQTPSASEPTPQRTRTRWWKLIQAVLILYLASLLARWSLDLAGWSPPIKYVSIAGFVLMLALIVWGMRCLWLWVRTVRWQVLLAVVLVGYLLAVSIAGLTWPGPESLGAAWLQAAVRVPQRAGRAIVDLALSIPRYPGRFRTAYVGERRFRGFPGADAVAETPVPAIDQASVDVIEIMPALESERDELSVGRRAITTARAGELCKMHALAGGPFEIATEVEVVEGPRYVKTEVWWRVRGPGGSAWCPSHTLRGQR